MNKKECEECLKIRKLEIGLLGQFWGYGEYLSNKMIKFISFTFWTMACLYVGSIL